MLVASDLVRSRVFVRVAQLAIHAPRDPEQKQAAGEHETNDLKQLGPDGDPTGLFVKQCRGPELYGINVTTTSAQFGQNVPFEDPTCPESGSWLQTGLVHRYGASVAGGTDVTSAGACYALYAPPADVMRPAGSWNQARIVVNGAHVEHWLNDVNVVTYELGSADWLARVGSSMFSGVPTYGRQPRGHIALQDHGDRVSYRAIKIRVLP